MDTITMSGHGVNLTMVDKNMSSTMFGLSLNNNNIFQEMQLVYCKLLKKELDPYSVAFTYGTPFTSEVSPRVFETKFLVTFSMLQKYQDNAWTFDPESARSFEITVVNDYRK